MLSNDPKLRLLLQGLLAFYIFYTSLNEKEMELLSEAAPRVGTMKSKWRLRSNRRHFFLFFTRVLMKLYERSNYGNYGISYCFSNDFARRYCICIVCCNLYSFVALKRKAAITGPFSF